MSSEDGRLKTIERISVEKQPELPPNSKKPRESFPAPRFKLSDGINSGLCVETEAVECALIALSSWNEKSKKGPEYVLVDALGCRRMVGPTIYHCNFIARPKNGIEAEDKLFFAELKYSKDFTKDGDDVALGCHVCCILGPSGTETGLCGCLSCELHHTLIHHPRNREFIQGRKDALLKYMVKKGRSKVRKRVAGPPDILANSRIPRLESIAPPVQLSYDDTHSCPDYKALECVNIALSSWNEKSLSEQGPEYELVDVVGCKRMVGPLIYHCNFLARPKNESEAEHKLFFAEVKYSRDFRKRGNAGAVGCRICCILGPSGTKTGLVGCKICVMHPDLMQHPENEDFIKGREDAFERAIAKAKRASMNWLGSISVHLICCLLIRHCIPLLISANSQFVVYTNLNNDCKYPT